MPYTVHQRQRILLKAKRVLGKANKSDAQDRADFMEQCIADMEDAGEEDAEQICQLLWDENGDE